MIPARISPAATNDLLDIADYLEEESFSTVLGRAFLKKAATTVAHRKQSGTWPHSPFLATKPERSKVLGHRQSLLQVPRLLSHRYERDSRGESATRVTGFEEDHQTGFLMWTSHSAAIATPLAPEHKILPQVQSHTLAVRLATAFPIPSRG